VARFEGASLIFVNRSREVLLFLRDAKDTIPYPNCWDIPGGHVEENESPEECIRREMLEEMGIDVGQPVPFRKYRLGDRTEHTFWKAVEIDIGAVDLREGQRLQWFSEEDVMKLLDRQMAYGFREILEDFCRERPFE
jgi:8-oxo-dGTP diphosphatase